MKTKRTKAVLAYAKKHGLTVKTIKPKSKPEDYDGVPVRARP